MDHPLAMYIQQSLSDAFELSGAMSSVTGEASGGGEILRARTGLYPYVP